MKRILFSKMKLFIFLFSMALVSVSCGSDDPDTDPIVTIAEEPDTDGDGVVDKEDICPNEAGLAALSGCPDADSDGVADQDDACPDVAGVAALAGCPDADVDGVADQDDVCPNEFGLAEFNGCPADAEESSAVVGLNILKINCGGGQVTIGDETFLTDQYFTGPRKVYVADASITEIENTELDEIYLRETISDDENASGPISYVIPITNGTYTVKLHFAEIYWGVPNPQNAEGGEGSRIFDIDIEDTAILNGFDLFKQAGGAAKAITKMYDIEVTDGELNILFTATVDRPKISAIEVFGDGTINP
jgi:hypothetical protein